MALNLMYITNDPKIAAIADKAKVDRVWIDLERLYKKERQSGMNTVKSHHTLEDIPKIKRVLKHSKLQVRINPINPDSKAEIDKAIEYGAEILMLPFFKSVDEVKAFLEFVDGRAVTNLLLETKEAVEVLDEILDLSGIDEIHIGLNDLHLSYGLKFMFQLISDGTVETLCKKIGKKGIPYGFGGIAKIGEGYVPAEHILAEHYRLKSSAAILSRSFYDTVDQNDYTAIEKFFIDGIKEIREYEKMLESKPEEFFIQNHKTVCKEVENIISSMY